MAIGRISLTPDVSAWLDQLGETGHRRNRNLETLEQVDETANDCGRRARNCDERFHWFRCGDNRRNVRFGAEHLDAVDVPPTFDGRHRRSRPAGRSPFRISRTIMSPASPAR